MITNEAFLCFSKIGLIIGIGNILVSFAVRILGNIHGIVLCDEKCSNNVKLCFRIDVKMLTKLWSQANPFYYLIYRALFLKQIEKFLPNANIFLV